MTAEQQSSDAQFAKLVEMVADLGYRAKPISEDRIPSSIATSMSGISVVLFHFPGHSIQMYAGFQREEDEKFGLEHVNRFNDEHRFIKCYIARGGTRFEGDFLFDIEDDDAGDQLRKIFLCWEAALGFATNAMSEVEEESEALAEEEIAGADRVD